MDIKEIKTRQTAFFQSGGTGSLDFRLECLEKLESAINERDDEILQALSSDLGKPGIEAYLSELYFVKAEIRLFRKKLRKWAKPIRAGAPFYHFPVRNEIRREPFGCAIIIAPWNYPFQLSVAPLVAAAAAGNCAVLKPSEMAPATAGVLAQIIEQAFHPEHVTVVEGDATVSKQLLAAPLDFVFFTGSEKTGREVGQAAGANLAPAVLELGGKCPVIVDNDIDVEKTANRIVSAKFFNAGQTCFAPDYVVVRQDTADQLVQSIENEIQSFYSVNGRGDMAGIINHHHYDRLQKLVNSSGGRSFQFGSDDAEELFFAPGIIANSNWDAPVMKEEIFGPVLPVISYSNDEELISRIQSKGHPLAMYLFSRNQQFCEKYINAIPSGSVGINDIGKQSSNLELPFGGVGTSGMGRYRGKFGFEAFTYQRPVSRKWFTKDLFSIQPPYAGKLEKNRKFLK